MEDDAVVEHERAHAWRSREYVAGSVQHMAANWATGSGTGFRPLRGRTLIVVFCPVALLLLGERDMEVVVEIAPDRGSQGTSSPSAA